MMTHEERVWHHEMETLEGIHEHAERIASLEELVLELLHVTWACDSAKCAYGGECNKGIAFMPECMLKKRARELEVMP